MPTNLLDVNFLLAAIVVVVGALSAFFAVKYGQAESHRLLLALHGRFDDLSKQVLEIRVEQARHDERLKQLEER